MKKEFVLEKLKKIKFEYNIDIIYAWLGGSRNFNTHTVDSDYDIFFVYDGVPSKKGMNYGCNGDCNYRIVGIENSRFLWSMSSGERLYALDNIRANIIYIPNEEFINKCYNLALTIDYNKFLLTFKKAIKRIYTGNYPLNIKRYKRILMIAMRYLWIEANQSCMYPMNTRILVEYFIDKDWYNSARYILKNPKKNLVLQDRPKLVKLFESIIGVI